MPPALKRGRSAVRGTSMCSTRWRLPLVPFARAARSKAVRAMSIPRSPIAWSITCQPALS